MSCGKCGKQYVGETKGPLNIRMNGHRDDWRHKRFERSLTAEQFCLQQHDFLRHAPVCCNSEWKDNARKSHESYWIRRLNTLSPSGINKKDKSRTQLQSTSAGASCIIPNIQCSTLTFCSDVFTCTIICFLHTVSYAS